jgi:hypothetical protein
MMIDLARERWRVVRDADGYAEAIVDTGGLIVVELSYAPDSPIPDVLAASPELLAACRLALDELLGGHEELVDILQAAIRNAAPKEKEAAGS